MVDQPFQLKNIYNRPFFEEFAPKIKAVYPAFDTTQFLALIFDEHWEALALKQRTRHIATALRQTLPKEYRAALGVLSAVGEKLENRFEYMFFPDFVAVYGLEDYEASIPALALFTQLCSSEFAVRPFIVQYPQKMMTQMMAWAKAPNHHVRRLASEGCRPRLPWGMALKAFKKDPTPILPILEVLKNDPSNYVRRSVANNLNDIAKDHPDIVLKTAKRWKGKSKEVDWVVKHACRTLLKKGNTTALLLFGFGHPQHIEIKDLAIKDSKINIGNSTQFSFTLINHAEEAVKTRLEYGIDFMKANGKQSRKIFQITENTYDSKANITFTRKQHFRNLTTRKHYAGQHHLAIIVNGIEKSKIGFELLEMT